MAMASLSDVVVVVVAVVVQVFGLRINLSFGEVKSGILLFNVSREVSVAVVSYSVGDSQGCELGIVDRR